MELKRPSNLNLDVKILINYKLHVPLLLDYFLNKKIFHIFFNIIFLVNNHKLYKKVKSNFFKKMLIYLKNKLKSDTI